MNVDSLIEIVSPSRGRQRIAARLQREGRLAWGRHSYAIPRIRTFTHDDTTKLTVGHFCSLGPEVTVLLGGNHPMDRVTTFPLREKLGLEGAGTDGFPSSRGSVVIGNDVWIAYGALVLSGVTIGDGAIVAAGSIVTRDVAPYEVVAGAPARHIRYRFDKKDREFLMQLRWWDWADEQIKERVALLADPHGIQRLRATHTA